MREVRLGPEDAGRAVEVRAGDQLVIALPETASSGYRWSVEEMPPGARVIEDRYERADKAPIGSASLHVMVIEGATAGTLRLQLSRPWQAEEGVVERFELTVSPLV